jgi:hypothetical protein
MTTPTIRDYVGTLGVNASMLASDIQDLLDHSQNAWVIAKLSVPEVSILEENIIALRDRIEAIRGDFNNNWRINMSWNVSGANYTEVEAIRNKIEEMAAKLRDVFDIKLNDDAIEAY